MDTEFRRHASAQPDAIAVDGPGGCLSYGELDLLVIRLAAELTPHRSQAVCAFTGKTLALPVALLASLRAGTVYVPCDPMDPDGRLSQLVTMVSPAVLITSPELVDRARAILGDEKVDFLVVRADGQIMDRETRGGQGGFRHAPDVPGLSGTPAYVFFTSGSTGIPKAIVGSAESLTDFVIWQAEALSVSQADRFSHFGAIGSDASLKDILTPLISGASVAIPPLDALEGAVRVSWAIEAKITVLAAVPTLFRTMLEAIESGPSLAARLDCLRLVLLAGEVVTPDVLRRWQSLFGERAPIANLYGATECTVFSVWKILTQADAKRSRVPIGHARRGFEIRVLNPVGRPCAIGELGEIWLVSDRQSLGYLGDAKATADRFHPDQNGKVAYRTGDIGRVLDDGCLAFVGRQDAQLKISGIRIEPSEVEAALGDLPHVADAVVLADGDAEDRQHLVAHILAKESASATASAIRSDLSRVLPAAMVPSKIVFHDAFPLTHTGKIDRKKLATHRAPKTSPATRALTPDEARLAAIWHALLGGSPASPEADFFEMGGHSLLAMQLQARIETELDVRMSLADVFQFSRLSEMAQMLIPSDLEVTRADPVVQGDGLTSGQRRLWFLNQLAADKGVYNVHCAFHLEGSLDQEALEQAFLALHERHPQLRLRIESNAGAPNAIINTKLSSEFRWTDLQSIPAHHRMSKAMDAANTDIAAPFDLNNGPLARLSIFQIAPEEHVAVMAVHHICSDMWSCAIMAADLSNLYTALVDGKAPELPDPCGHFSDHVRAEATLLASDNVKRLQDYWTEALNGMSSQPLLKPDKPRQAQRRFQGELERLSIGRYQMQKLAEFASQSDATMFMVMLAVFAIVLRQRSGSNDILIGTDLAGRADPSMKDVVGFFVEQVPLRCDMSGNPQVSKLLARVRSTTISAFDHQGLPFDVMVQTVRGSVDPVAPLFSVKLVGQTGPRPEIALSGITATPVKLHRGTAHLDLTLRYQETADGLELVAEYDTDVFLASTIRDLLNTFETTLRTVLRDPEIRLDAFQQMSSKAWAAAGQSHKTLSALRRVPSEGLTET